MIGAIAGDIIGSVYEGRGKRIKAKDFPLFSLGCRFTDDTVLTIALADSLLHGRSYETLLREYYHRYPYAGYGGMFRKWAQDPEGRPYNSFGNGSAMRISPVGFACSSLEEAFGYDLSRTLDEIRPWYRFDVTCQGSVPEAIIAFLESTDYEDAVRNAVSLGGDSDTQACITGGIAQAFYGGIPDFIRKKVYGILDEGLKKVALEFTERYITPPVLP